VGHPLISKIKSFLRENPSIRRSSNKKVIAILPGSRKDEITHHLPVLIKTVKLLKKEFDIEVNISKSPNLDSKLFKDYINTGEYNITGENVYNLILNADLVITKAGTSTMECSLIGTPYMIFYKTFPLNYYILKPIVKINNLGIANILLKKNIVKEFIQKDFTAENLAEESKKILTNDTYRNEMIENLRKIWNILGNEDASFTAAKKIKQFALA
jgi:lipid-A-disaccharide synthase